MQKEQVFRYLILHHMQKPIPITTLRAVLAAATHPWWLSATSHTHTQKKESKSKTKSYGSISTIQPYVKQLAMVPIVTINLWPLVPPITKTSIYLISTSGGEKKKVSI